jgi:hypothetical protein
MGDPSDTVDAYLDSRFRTGLEQVLLDASGGYVSPALAGTIGVISEQSTPGAIPTAASAKATRGR